MCIIRRYCITCRTKPHLGLGYLLLVSNKVEKAFTQLIIINHEDRGCISQSCVVRPRD